MTVRGICGPQGQKPVISGHGAAARPGYDTGVTNANKWVVKIGRSGSNKDNNYLSSYVIIENIEVTDCLPEYTFTAVSYTHLDVYKRQSQMCAMTLATTSAKFLPMSRLEVAKEFDAFVLL